MWTVVSRLSQSKGFTSNIHHPSSPGVFFWEKQNSSMQTNMDHTHMEGKEKQAQELSTVMNHSELTGFYKQMHWSATSTPTCTYKSAVYIGLPDQTYPQMCVRACVRECIMNANNKCPWGLICAPHPHLCPGNPFYWGNSIQRVNRGLSMCLQAKSVGQRDTTVWQTALEKG